MRTSSIIGAAVVGIMAISMSAAAGSVKCEGGNACKGQGGCKNPKMAKKHAAKSCAGKSFTMEKDQAACDAAVKAAKPAEAAPSETPKG